MEFKYQGKWHKKHFRELPIEVRRVLVFDNAGYLEPQSLFLGKSGFPPSQRYWHMRFSRANKRINEIIEPRNSSYPKNITPHDLRHTFAVVLLQSLTKRALENETRRSKAGTGSLSEHIIFNPLLTLQRLMGHSSPITTMSYLRYLDDSKEIVQKAFESWDEPSLDYADYVLRLIKKDEINDE